MRALRGTGGGSVSRPCSPPSSLNLACSTLQLALKLVEEAPVGRLSDELVRRQLDHPGFAQAQRVEAQRVLGIVDPPRVVGNFLQGLQRIVVARGEATIDDRTRCRFRIATAEVGRLEDCAQ